MFCCSPRRPASALPPSPRPPPGQSPHHVLEVELRARLQLHEGVGPAQVQLRLHGPVLGLVPAGSRQQQQARQRRHARKREERAHAHRAAQHDDGHRVLRGLRRGRAGSRAGAQSAWQRSGEGGPPGAILRLTHTCRPYPRIRQGPLLTMALPPTAPTAHAPRTHATHHHPRGQSCDRAAAPVPSPSPPLIPRPAHRSRKRRGAWIVRLPQSPDPPHRACPAHPAHHSRRRRGPWTSRPRRPWRPPAPLPTRASPWQCTWEPRGPPAHPHARTALRLLHSWWPVAVAAPCCETSNSRPGGTALALPRRGLFGPR